MWDGKLVRIKESKLRTDLNSTGECPNHSTSYQVCPRAQDIEKHNIDKRLVVDMIEPGQTESVAPIVFACKKEGTLRFRVDYCKLSAVTILDSYAVQCMDECLDIVGDGTILSILDANCGFWQVEIVNEDREKTAFLSCHVPFCNSWIPLGLKTLAGRFNGPWTSYYVQ